MDPSTPSKMASLEAISAEIEAISWRKENLRKAFEQLQSHSSCLSSPLQWQEVEDHFDPTLKSIDETFRVLSSRFSAKSPPSDPDQNQNPTEKKRREPSARRLLSLLMKNLDYLPKIKKLTAKLRSSSDPAKLGLDVMDGLVGRRGLHFLLESLMVIAPEVKKEVKERAMGRAMKWKEKISVSNACNCKREARAFVSLVIAYDLASYFEQDELFEAMCKFTGRNIKINFFRKLGLVKRIPYFIQKLVSERKHIAAVNFVRAFELEDEFPPLSLLESYLEETKKSAQEICRKENDPIKSAAKEIKAMKAVLKCIGQHKLKAGSLPESVKQSIANLKKQQAEMKCKATTTSPQPQQQPVKKRPRSAAMVAVGPQKVKKYRSQPKPATTVPQMTRFKLPPQLAAFPQVTNFRQSFEPRAALPSPQMVHIEAPPQLAATPFPQMENFRTPTQPATASLTQMNNIRPPSEPISPALTQGMNTRVQPWPQPIGLLANHVSPYLGSSAENSASSDHLGSRLNSIPFCSGGNMSPPRSHIYSSGALFSNLYNNQMGYTSSSSLPPFYHPLHELASSSYSGFRST